MDLEKLKAYLMAQKEQAPVSDEELADQRFRAGLVDAAREGSDIMSGHAYKGPSGALQDRVKASVAAREAADKRNFLLQQLANKKSAEQVVNPLQAQQIDASKANVESQKAKDVRENKKSFLENKLLGKEIEGFVSDEDKFLAAQANKAADRALNVREYEDAKEMRELAVAKAKKELELMGKVDPQTKYQIDLLNFKIRQYEEAAPDRELDRLKKALEVGGLVTDRERFEFEKKQDSEDRKAKQSALDTKIKAAAEKSKKSDPKAHQLASAGFGRRLEQTEAIFDNLLKSGYQREGFWSGAAQSKLPSGMQSDEARQQEQAERNFINAVLRQESGAAIGKDEYTNAEEQYFPRYGDTPQTLANKKANRLQKLEEFKAASGEAWEKVPLVLPEGISQNITVVHKPSGRTKVLTADEFESLKSRDDFNDFEVK